MHSCCDDKFFTTRVTSDFVCTSVALNESDGRSQFAGLSLGKSALICVHCANGYIRPQMLLESRASSLPLPRPWTANSGASPTAAAGATATATETAAAAATETAAAAATETAATAGATAAGAATDDKGSSSRPSNASPGKGTGVRSPCASLCRPLLPSCSDIVVPSFSDLLVVCCAVSVPASAAVPAAPSKTQSPPAGSADPAVSGTAQAGSGTGDAAGAGGGAADATDRAPPAAAAAPGRMLEFLVKWKCRSHWFDTWVPQCRLEHICGSLIRGFLKAEKKFLAKKQRLAKLFERDNDLGMSHVCSVASARVAHRVACTAAHSTSIRVVCVLCHLPAEQGSSSGSSDDGGGDSDVELGVKAEWLVPERIVAQRVLSHAKMGKNVDQVLVKWSELEYDASTWEKRLVLERRGHAALMDRFHSLNTSSLHNVDGAAAEDDPAAVDRSMGGGKLLRASPSFIGSGRKLFPYQIEVWSCVSLWPFCCVFPGMAVCNCERVLAAGHQLALLFVPAQAERHSWR